MSRPEDAAIPTATRTQANTVQDRLAAAQAHFQAGRPAKAEPLCRQLLRKEPGHAGALHLMGLIARQAGRIERALQLLEKAASGAPGDAAILCDLGNALKAVGRYEDAVARYRAVVALLPDSAAALSNLVTIHTAWGRPRDAVDLLERAAQQAPADAKILYNLGNALMAVERFAEAAETLRRAVALDPVHIRARTNLGVALKEAGRLDEAVAALRNALALAPGHADAGWNLALALLMGGDYDAGWAAYEWRRAIPDFAMRRVDGAPWDGGDLAGRTLLVHAEQGLGDSIQFARYLKLAAARGGRVVFACQDGLAPLLAGLRGGAEIIGLDDAPPPYDVQALLLSLPHLLGGGAPLVPANAAYLDPDRDRAARWRARLAGPDIKVGIAWQGRPDYKADSQRSVRQQHFAPLADIPGVGLYSLQKGAGAEQLDDQPRRCAVTPFGACFDRDGAFLDSAAVIAGLDLVVTSDTAIAHLAGALGVEVWVVLAHVPDWRWGLAGGTCPWYPSMRLFRKERPGDWPGVFDRVAAALRARVSPPTA